jgi:hypothetical protein
MTASIYPRPGRYEIRFLLDERGKGHVHNFIRSETMDLKSGLRSRSLGMLLLGLWLILTGLLPLIDVRISTTISTALALLAIVAGILILLGR